MAPLSMTLSGVPPPPATHDTCASHLDSQTRTTEVELEKKDFKAAGEILAEIWGAVVLTKFPVVSEYVSTYSLDPVPHDEKWVSVYCRISNYFLQIVTCMRWECYGESRITWIRTFPTPLSFRFCTIATAVRRSSGSNSQ